MGVSISWVVIKHASASPMVCPAVESGYLIKGLLRKTSTSVSTSKIAYWWTNRASACMHGLAIMRTSYY